MSNENKTIKVKILRCTQNEICNYSDNVGETIEVIVGKHHKCYLTTSHPQYFILMSDCEIIPPQESGDAEGFLENIVVRFEDHALSSEELFLLIQQYAQMKVAEERGKWMKDYERETKRLDSRIKYLGDQLGEVCRESNSQLSELAELKQLRENGCHNIAVLQQQNAEMRIELDRLTNAEEMPSLSESEIKLNEFAKNMNLDFTKISNEALAWRLCYEWMCDRLMPLGNGKSIIIDWCKKEMIEIEKRKDFASGAGDAEGYARNCGQSVLIERILKQFAE